MKIFHPFIIFFFAALLWSCNAPAKTFSYQDIPAGFDFPADENKLLALVNNQDMPAMRAHAWNLWAGLTTDSRSLVNGRGAPIFQTWFNDTEVFDERFGDVLKSDAQRALTHPLAVPRQILHTRATGAEQSALVMGFVKYNKPAASFIWENKYYLKSTLNALQKKFDDAKTPPDARTINPFPKDAVVLKPTFWLIKNANSPATQNGLTALPYWDPQYPPPADGLAPTHNTWAKCVAVDPAKKFPAGSTQKISCNPPKGSNALTDARVMYLDDFYAYQLITDSDVADAKTFLAELSSASGLEERLVANANQIPEKNDFIILTAMHVTTKELDNWTFQTFWWVPDADAPPFGHDKPASVRGPFRNFQMCTAWSMDTPVGANGALPICFNPYLETDLGPTKPLTLNGQTFPVDPMAGTRSNCQSCHNRAGYPAFQDNNPTSANYGRVFNEGFLAPNDAYYSTITKTDFLWSLIFHSQPK